MTLTPDAPTGPAAPAGIVDERLRDKLTPYLGPDPVSSRQLGTAFRILSMVGAAVWLLRAVVSYAQADLEPELVVSSTGLITVQGAHAELLGLLSLVVFPLVVALIAVDLLWRRERRPKERLQARGEAYVELPMIWVFPMRYRLVLGAGVALAVLAGMKSQLTDVTILTDPTAIQEAYRWSAVSAIGWAVLWATGAALPWMADRAHDRRLEWSAWYRDRPETVGYVLPVRDNDIGEPAGFGWILRTAGLVLLGFLGLIFLAAGMEILGEGDTAAAAFWLFLAAMSEVVVIRAFVRRRKPQSVRGGF